GLGDARVHLVLLLSGVREEALEDLVRGERKAELRRRPSDASRPALEEGPEALLLVDGPGSVPQPGIGRVALTRLDLESGLDHVARCGQVRGGHTGNGAGREQLQDSQL